MDGGKKEKSENQEGHSAMEPRDNPRDNKENPKVEETTNGTLPVPTQALDGSGKGEVCSECGWTPHPSVRNKRQAVTMHTTRMHGKLQGSTHPQPSSEERARKREWDREYRARKRADAQRFIMSGGIAASFRQVDHFVILQGPGDSLWLAERIR